MQILEEFWYGNIHPNERHGESNIEMIKISDLIKRHEGTLIKSLDEKNKEIFEKYRDCYDELTQLNECEVFKIGFKLGVRMLLECYDDLATNLK